MQDQSNSQQNKGKFQQDNPSSNQMPLPPYDPTIVLENLNSNTQNPYTGQNNSYPPYSQSNSQYQPPNTNYQQAPNTNYQQPPPSNTNYQQPPPSNTNYQQPPNYYYQQPPSTNYQQQPDYHYQPPANYQPPAPEPFVDGPCSYNRTHENTIRQPFYNCITCGLVDDLGCCEACARICHAGHQLVPRGNIECYCDCGSGNVSTCVRCRCLKVPASQAQLYDQYTQQQQIPQCTYLQTGRRMVNQRLYTCVTCHFDQGTCICESCARVCHYGHDVRSLGVTAGFCDCGAGNIPGRCRCMNGTPCSHCCQEDIGTPVYVDACNLQ